MENEQWIKVKPGSPRDTEQLRTTACGVALLLTGLFGFLGCLALLSSDPKSEETGHRILKVAKVTGDLAERVCNC